MESGLDDGDNKEFFDLIRRLLTENYCILASSVLLWFDHIISFDQEVQRIWQRKISGASILFFITRYSATLERITLVVSLFLVTNNNPMSRCMILTVSTLRCVPVLRLDDVLNDISIFIVGAFAALRLYAIFGRDWRVLVPMLAIAVARVIISIYFQANYTPIAFGPPLWGCGAIFNVTPNTYFHLSADTLLLILTWVKTFEIRRASNGFGVHTPISTLLLRDGTLYFVLICALQIMSIVSTQIGSDFPLFAVWVYWTQSFTVIFLCRFMLNLRGVYMSPPGAHPHHTSGTTTTTGTRSDLHFASQIVGNLGAPLHMPFASANSSSSNASSSTSASGTSQPSTSTAAMTGGMSSFAGRSSELGTATIAGSETVADSQTVGEGVGVGGGMGADKDGLSDDEDGEVIEISDDPLSVGLTARSLDVEMTPVVPSGGAVGDVARIR